MASRVYHRGHVIPAQTDHLELAAGCECDAQHEFVLSAALSTSDCPVDATLISGHRLLDLKGNAKMENTKHKSANIMSI